MGNVHTQIIQGIRRITNASKNDNLTLLALLVHVREDPGLILSQDPIQTEIYVVLLSVSRQVMG
jgi:hypothetical protein